MVKFLITVLSYSCFIVIIYALAHKVGYTTDGPFFLRDLLYRASAIRGGIVARSMIKPENDIVTTKCLCSKIYDPVCASNNKSFYNPCRMFCYARHKNLTLHVLHPGNCIVF